MNDEDIGYLKRAVEDLTAKQLELYGIIKEHMRREELERQDVIKVLETIQARITTVENQLSMAKTMIKVSKATLYVLAAILTLKVGDIPDILKNLSK